MAERLLDEIKSGSVAEQGLYGEVLPRDGGLLSRQQRHHRRGRPLLLLWLDSTPPLFHRPLNPLNLLIVISTDFPASQQHAHKIENLC